MERRITGTTGLLALIGSPVGHSGSPAMYNYSFQRLGLDYAYVAFDIKIDEVEQAIAAMRTFKMRGCNVTMPCKSKAAEYMDRLSPAARIIGAVNTIVNDDGVLTGHITDGEGFVANLKDHGIDIAGKKITVAGGGGAATAIQVQCALDGAREITIFNIKDDFFARTLETAEKIRAEKPECIVNVYDIADTAKMTEEIQSSDIFANATIVGMKPLDGESVVKDTKAFYPGLVVCDAVYNPKETRLLREAKEAGCTCISGEGMLLWQGVAAFRLYTGQDMPVEEVKELFFRDKKSKSHIFLIGFMGAGKSSIAAELCKNTDKQLMEMDAELVQREGMAISDIFEKYGEEYFRDAESKLVCDLQQMDARVVSCGGGVVVRPQNVENMKKTGTVILLTAKPETIYERVKNSQDRPILNGNMNVEYIRELMKKRESFYLQAADHVIETDNKSIADICKEIMALT